MAASSSPDGAPQVDEPPADPAGPYETEQQARADCRNVYDQAHTQPRGAMWRSNEERATAVGDVYLRYAAGVARRIGGA